MLIRSGDSLESVGNALKNYDDRADVKPMGTGMYEIRTDASSDLGTILLSGIDTDQIPEKLLGTYDVIQPRSIESFQSADYLTGELLPSLWGISKI